MIVFINLNDLLLQSYVESPRVSYTSLVLLLYLNNFTMITVPALKYPNCLHTTLASLQSQL